LLACALGLGACAQSNPSDAASGPATGPASVTAPSTTTDPGSRFVDAEAPIGAITVESQPIDGSWTGGPTSIARPAPGSPYPNGDPDQPGTGPAQPYPPPPVTRSVPPPPPLPSR
jgi:hypothetical protein